MASTSTRLCRAVCFCVVSFASGFLCFFLLFGCSLGGFVLADAAWAFFCCFGCSELAVFCFLVLVVCLASLRPLKKSAVQKKIIPSSTNTPPSSAITLTKKYQVFLSFRGEDTRVGFTSHLEYALSRTCMLTFIDYKLERGDEISPALLKSIQESMIAVVIFSKDYASSKWCLRELAEIMKCNKLRELTVIPVFYYVNPTDVRNQTGPFKDSFAKHEHESQDEVQEWREAFTEASNRSGWDYTGTRSESELVRDIVEDVQGKLMSEVENLNDFEGLIGMDKRIEHFMSLSRPGTEDVRTIGIWGMGGIGKTTLAESVFNRISSEFDSSCFIENVEEILENRESKPLRLEVLSEVLQEKNLKLSTPTFLPPLIKQRLTQKKVLIVFDGVNKFRRPLETLVNDLIRCGSGSIIIITSRDKHVLNNYKVFDCNIYEVKGLNFDEALMLFSNYAFNQNHPTEGFMDLSVQMICYANGNPLGLRVLGSHLLGKDKQEWESAFDDLQGIGDSEIFNILKISYDGLSDVEKDLFLDIACFFNGYYEDNIAKWLDCKGPLRSLTNKSLIKIKGGGIKMHDLLQEMGREMVRGESPKNPGKRSRLWKADDVIWTLKNNKETKAVEGIYLGRNYLHNVHLILSCQVFSKMPNLRLLLFNSGVEFHFPYGLNSLPNDLIVLKWYRYPLRALPSDFSPEKLVKLNLSFSNIEQLWKGTKHAPKLKWLILSCCRHLTRIPNLSGFLSLEEVDLTGCKSLVEFPSSVQQLNQLRYLSLDGCSNVTKFPLTSESIKRLNLRKTAIEEVPKSIQSLTNLEELNCSECKGLTSLPPLSGLRSLSKLYLKKCNLMEIPEDIGCLSSLEWLDLCGNMFESLPKSIKHLSMLKTLLLRDCNMLRSLTELPVALIELDATNCMQLCQALPDASEFKRCITRFRAFLFINCFNLDQKAVRNFFEESLKGLEEPPTRLVICLPGTEIPDWFTYKSSGSSVNVQVLRQDLVNRKFMGFVICAVLGKGKYHRDLGFRFLGFLSVDVCCQFEICFPQYSNLGKEPEVIFNSNHIFLGHYSFSGFCSSSQNLEMLIANESDYVDIPFEFQSRFELKDCAVHPIGATIEDIEETSVKRSGGSNDNEEEVEPHPKTICTQPN